MRSESWLLHGSPKPQIDGPFRAWLCLLAHQWCPWCCAVWNMNNECVAVSSLKITYKIIWQMPLLWTLLSVIPFRFTTAALILKRILKSWLLAFLFARTQTHINIIGALWLLWLWHASRWVLTAAACGGGWCWGAWGGGWGVLGEAEGGGGDCWAGSCWVFCHPC